MKEIPKSYADILQKPSFAHFSTLMPDGSPQSSPVWIDADGPHLLINSAEGRVKDQNIRRDPRVAVSITDPDNPYRCLMIRGRVSKITNEGADDHINRMAKKYLGVDEYPYGQPGEVRVLYYIEPESVAAWG
ncbi:MAG: PPOX class F420-dependent oxidoreductase [Myxococcales bacterium]|jgi:PPOX class probable F420-dependent enzyme